MLTLQEFLVLRCICETGENAADVIAQKTEVELDAVSSITSVLIERGYIDSTYKITQNGLDVLEPYRVRNAIMLAAGTSRRFAPLSYEKPKGLVAIKGERMIERQIEQLHAVGITEIIVVVGYLMEKFFYLAEKYGVKLVPNHEYALRNNNSSIYLTRKYIGNSYILSSDNYYSENIFHAYEYRAIYTACYCKGEQMERAMFLNDDLLILDTVKPAKDQWIFLGHGYMDEKFAKTYKTILENEYNNPGVDQYFWENFYTEHVSEFEFYALKCKEGVLLEFDSIEEAKAYDPNFMEYNDCSAFDNICTALDCKKTEIENIEIITKEMNDNSVNFTCKGQTYTYTHPKTEKDNFVLCKVND